jgi:hypothetical protein
MDFQVYKDSDKDEIKVLDPNTEKHKCWPLSSAFELLINMTHLKWKSYEVKLIEAGYVDELTKYYSQGHFKMGHLNIPFLMDPILLYFPQEGLHE